MSGLMVDELYTKSLSRSWPILLMTQRQSQPRTNPSHLLAHHKTILKDLLLSKNYLEKNLSEFLS